MHQLVLIRFRLGADCEDIKGKWNPSFMFLLEITWNFSPLLQKLKIFFLAKKKKKAIKHSTLIQLQPEASLHLWACRAENQGLASRDLLTPARRVNATYIVTDSWLRNYTTQDLFNPTCFLSPWRIQWLKTLLSRPHADFVCPKSQLKLALYQ